MIPRWAGPNDPPKLALIIPRWAGPNDPPRLALIIPRRAGPNDLALIIPRWAGPNDPQMGGATRSRNRTDDGSEQPSQIGAP